MLSLTKKCRFGTQKKSVDSCPLTLLNVAHALEECMINAFAWIAIFDIKETAAVNSSNALNINARRVIAL